MLNKNLSATAGILLLAAILLAACASGQSAGATGTPISNPSESETPVVLPPTAISPTPLPGTGGTETPDSSQVTLADNRTSVTLHVGQSFLLKLGEQYDWNINVADQTIVSRVKNIAVIRGAQGVYDALKAGTTTLSATGDPLCRQSKPACAMPSIDFEVTLVVEP